MNIFFCRLNFFSIEIEGNRTIMSTATILHIIIFFSHSKKDIMVRSSRQSKIGVNRIFVVWFVVVFRTGVVKVVCRVFRITMRSEDG